MEWISVEDRLPEMNQMVLVYLPECKFFNYGFDEWTVLREAPVGWSSATIETGEGWAENDFEDVSHWMPLPLPPVSLSQSSSKTNDQDGVISPQEKE